MRYEVKYSRKPIFQYIFTIVRAFVRLGEYDTGTDDDGPHTDVDVAEYLQHEDFDRKSLENDIALIYLEHDVNFNGKRKKNQFNCLY